jgi:cardiolipin synthase
VQPFYDNPFSKKSLSENAYLWTINNAKEYVYICTPYLILDSQTIHALKFASISGVDVRIIVPHIPDKKNVNEVTRSHYLELLQAGVKIFEFKDGFIHSKTIVSDDSLAVVGTANFDFRSFYMHFENGILMYKTSAVMQVKQDCLNLCEQQALKISLEDCQNLPLYKKLIRSILRLFSPLM